MDEHFLVGGIERVAEHESLAIGYFQQETHKIFAPARDHRIGFRGFVEKHIERVEVNHPDAPSIYRHLHAAAVVEVVEDAFGSGLGWNTRLGELSFGPAALRVPGFGLVHVFSNCVKGVVAKIGWPGAQENWRTLKFETAA